MNRTLAGAASLLVVLAVVGGAFLVPGPADGAGGKVDPKKKYRAIKKEIKSREEKLKQAERVENMTLGDLDSTNRELVAISRDLKKYRARLQGTQKDVRVVREEIALLSGKLQTRKGLLKRKLRAMHRYGAHGDTLLVLGRAEDLQQFLRRWRYLKALAMYEGEGIREFRRDLSALKDRRAQLNGLQERLERVEGEVLAKEGTLIKKKRKKEVFLTSVRHKKAAYGRMLGDLRKSAAKISKMLRKSGSYSGSGFRGGRGRLPWPVYGAVTIPYGTQNDPKFKTPVFRNGIYIEVPEETVAKAVYKGKVVFADWFKGYGQVVIVNHGSGYHSLYGNLSEIFLKAGDIIERSREIGSVGTSGLIDRPSLYFEIRYKGKPLDPAQWLKKR